MGRLVVAAALAVAWFAPGALAAPRAREAPAEGFDHITHRGRVEARALPPPPCSRCHSIGAGGALVGSPGHAACFGDCHGPPPRPARGAIEPAARRLCSACHRPADVVRLERGALRRLRSAFPPYGRDRDFALTMSHAAHAGVARGCRACHAAPPDRGAAPSRTRRARPTRAPVHARCAGCHERAPGRVGMSACSSCHAPQVGTSLAPRSEPGRFPVGDRFSHRRHLGRIGGADPCRACHAAAAAEKGDRIPTPKKQQCRTCHDGRRAFSLIEASCRRCHGPPAREEASLGLRRERFSHRAHVSSKPGLDCSACHALDPRGAPVTALRGHASCGAPACHASDFAVPAPITCGVCHVRAEPWRDLHADPVPADASEFGVDFSHRHHLPGGPGPDRSCGRCHRAAAAGRFQPAAGHSACAGSTCHAQARGPAPSLSRCRDCHVLGLSDRHEQARRSRRWSVRDLFSHASHATEPSAPGRPVSCVGCHAGAPASTSLADMPAPGKPSCVRCHDGRVAFKVTGHACARCHVPAQLRTATGSRSGTARSAPPR
jgi:c(7)-type cytochrome triheme protein